jgi:ELWxxDGT repeat protein
MVKDTQPGANSVGPRYLTNVAGTLFFGTNAGLWKSDGSAEGTVRVHDAGPNGEMISIGDTLISRPSSAEHSVAARATSCG